MNTCFLSLDYPSVSGESGVGNQVKIMGHHLAKCGHQVTVVSLARPNEPLVTKKSGVRIFRIALKNIHWYIHKIPVIGSLFTLSVRELEYSWGAYQKIRILHAQQPFDLIEGTETGALWVSLMLRDIPLVIRLHGERYTYHKYTPDLPLTKGLKLSRVLQRVAIRRAKALSSPSQAHANEIAAEMGMDPSNIEVIPNGVVIPNTIQQQRDSTTVLFVGRLDRGKGVPLLLEAASYVLKEIPKTRFIFAGGHHPTLDKKDLIRLTQQFGLTDNARFLGHVPQKHLARLYQQATVCVLPSYYESFGLAVLEAMTFELPVIATKAGGLDELIEDGVSGLLVSKGDRKRLVTAIVQLLRDRELDQQMGIAGRIRAQNLYDIKQQVERTQRFYQTVISR